MSVHDSGGDLRAADVDTDGHSRHGLTLAGGAGRRVGERTDFGTYIFTFKSYAHGVNEGDDETGSADNLDVLDMDHSDMGIGDPFAPPHAVHADASLEMRRMHRLLQRMETRSSINGIANAAIKWSLSTRK